MDKIIEDRIEFKLCKLKNQVPTEIKESFICIYSDHLHFVVEFFANEAIIEDDMEAGHNEGVYNYYNIIAHKSKISGIEFSFTKDRLYGIYIIVTGFAQDIKMYFSKKSEAIPVFEKIKNWLLSK